MINDLPDRIAAQLSRPRDGAAVRRKWAPELSYGRHDGPPVSGTRQAAVVLLLYPKHNQWHIPLTLRPPNMRDHAGQVSLPGGSVDPDETDEVCALRELHEELGIEPADVRMLGKLTPLFVFGTRFWVTPCVASLEQEPFFRPNPQEVQLLLEAAVSDLKNPTAHGRQLLQRRGIRFWTPTMDCHGHPIWGATCMILGEFLSVAKAALERTTAN